MRYWPLIVVFTSLLLQTGCNSCKKEEPVPVRDPHKVYTVQLPPAALSAYPEFVTDDLPLQTPEEWKEWIVGKWRFDMAPHLMEFRFLPGGTVISKHIIQGQKPIIGRGRYALQKDLTIFYHIYGLNPIISPFVMSGPDKLMFVIGDEAHAGVEGLEFVVQAERVKEESAGDGE